MLGIAQPAISRQIRSLEVELRQNLLTERGVAPEVAAAAEQSAVAMREAAQTAAGLIRAIEDARVEVEAAAEIARLYDTVFGRAPDLAGLTFWKEGIEANTATLTQAADAFTSSAEFRSQYGSLNNREFANALYVNTLDRPADQAGLDYWTGQLNSGVSRATVALAFSESAEHVALTAPDIQSENPAAFGVLFA